MFPDPAGPAFTSNESSDEKVGNLEKRKHGIATNIDSSSESDDAHSNSKRCGIDHLGKCGEDVDKIVERKLKSFKESLLADMRGMLQSCPPNSHTGSTKAHISDPPTAPESATPLRVTRSASLRSNGVVKSQSCSRTATMSSMKADISACKESPPVISRQRTHVLPSFSQSSLPGSSSSSHHFYPAEVLPANL